MTISLEQVREVLLKDNLLKEFITPNGWTLTIPESLNNQVFHSLSYDSRQVDKHTLFFCKGLNFKKNYLKTAIDSGVTIYLSEQPFDIPSTLAIIVTDIKKAMAVLSMTFYDFPQNKLKLIGFTGTKGKTTAAYFTKFILDHTTSNKVAMLSTMNSTLDGELFFKSQLTTPESLDLYRMMAQAVKNKMTYFIMEVSSQAYKTDRVYNLFFDVGIFLNITPDHISPIEHPTFDDYFYCKRQLISHSKTMILNHDSDYFQILKETAKLLNTPFITYGSRQEESVDYYYQARKTNPLIFTLESTNDFLAIAGNYQIQLGGDFNKGNATSAILASALLDATQEDCQKGISEAAVPGRMEQLKNNNGASIYVDYAHNYDSLKNLLTFVKKEHPSGKTIVVIGSTGNKAISRRKDFGTVLSEFADTAILTTDDPENESPLAICQEIAQYITTEIQIEIILEREAAIQMALTMSQPEDAVVLAGKGADLYQKIEGQQVTYVGDYNVAKNFVQKGLNPNINE